MPYLTDRGPTGDAAAVGVDLDQHHGSPQVVLCRDRAHHQHRLAAVAVGEVVEVGRAVVVAASRSPASRSASAGRGGSRTSRIRAAHCRSLTPPR